MEIKSEKSGDKEIFYIELEGKRLAQMYTSMRDSSNMIIEHTEVSDALKGKGAGKQLVSAGVDYARKNNLKIIPLCPFARKVFEKVKEYQDVLA
jgi:uncharacterized protein